MTKEKKWNVGDKTLELIHHAADRAMDYVSAGDTMVPFVMTMSNNEKNQYTLMAEDMPGAMDMLVKIINDKEKNIDAYAFAYDIVLRDANGNGKQDAIILEAAERDGDQAVRLIQKYEPQTGEKEFSRIGDLDFADHTHSRFGAGAIPRGDGDLRARFSDDEWNTLIKAPFLVFLGVAASDGKVDKKEIKEFNKQMVQAMMFDSELISTIFTDAIQQIPSMLQALVTTPIDPQAIFADVVRLLEEKVDDQQADLFKKALLFIGKNIAEASGGFLGFGRKISKDEAVALASIAALLKIKL
jgi:hypothetical protein